MPRPKAPSNTAQEDGMDEETFEDWESVAEGFGTKVVFDNIGDKFSGKFTGTRTVELTKDGGDLEVAKAAEFTKNGQKYWCWIPYQLREAIDSEEIIPGDVVQIEFTGESETKRGLNPVKVFTIRRKPRD